MPRISESERFERWLDRLQRHSYSGQTIAEFCSAEASRHRRFNSGNDVNLAAVIVDCVLLRKSAKAKIE